MQRQYYKLGKRRGVKQRIFKRAPLHDSFRTLPEQLEKDSSYIFRNYPKGNLHESKITARFWIITILTAAMAIITLKIR